MKEILLFVAGIILGGGITAFIFLKLFPAVGCLREDRSDPTAPPYLFLELRPDGYEKIHKKQAPVQKKEVSIREKAAMVKPVEDEPETEDSRVIDPVETADETGKTEPSDSSEE